MVTLRGVRPVPWYGGLVQAEDVLARCLGARMHAVELAAPRYGRAPVASPHVHRVLAVTRLGHPYRLDPPPAGPRSDVVLLLANDLHDVSMLLGLRQWSELGEVVLVHVAEISPRDLKLYPDVVRHLCDRADHLFTGTEGLPHERLRRGRVRTVSVVPPLLDVLGFPTRPLAEQRTIDVLNVGRRDRTQHELLRQWAIDNDGYYVRDTGYIPTVTSLADHRETYAATCSRAGVFITNFARFDQPEQHGGVWEVGTRFYEGMAAGCVLAGELPVRSTVFRERIAPIEPVSFPLGATSLPAGLLAVLSDPHAAEDRRRMSRAAALRAHDAAHRWQEMAAIAGLPSSPAIAARVAELDRLAAAVLAGVDRPGDDGSGGEMRHTLH